MFLCEHTDGNNLPFITQGYSLEYDLGKFAILRGYITPDELAKITNKRFDLREQIELEEEKEEEREKKFNAKYGSDQSKWSDKVWEEYENQ